MTTASSADYVCGKKHVSHEEEILDDPPKYGSLLTFRLNSRSPVLCIIISYTTVHVFVKTKPGTENAFREASLKNARESAKEPGIARFDVLQDKYDKSQFVLVEVYKTTEAPAAHKDTPHYLEWRETVADMMAEPRRAQKFVNHFPKTSAGWDCKFCRSCYCWLFDSTIVIPVLHSRDAQMMLPRKCRSRQCSPRVGVRSRIGIDQKKCKNAAPMG